MAKKVEILSPAGSYESLRAAVAAGADAVYIGGTKFGARAYADNLQEDMLLEAIDYVHLHGRKIYLTLNTLFKEEELKNELYEYLLPYYERGIDAVIVQDIGVLTFIREQFPDLPIHASTQMTITNVLGAKFLETLGVERVVTAREMQLHEIREIAEQTNLEIESFVHGALCYCYSGQCLYSSLIGGRSGNRGQCAQPCRLPYRVTGDKKSQYIMSLKDMCTLEYIPELVEAGITSFKIEGRMKKPEYVALVTAMYRKYLHLYLQKGKQAFSVHPKDREMLMDLYNRGGSHGGYYHTKNGRDMVSLERPNHAGVPALKVVKQNGKQILAEALVDIQKGDVIELCNGKEIYTFAEGVQKGKKATLFIRQKDTVREGQVLSRTRNASLIAEIQDTIISKEPKVKAHGVLELATGQPAKLQLRSGEIAVTVYGDIVQEALKQPMEKERLEKQLRKTGNTEFVFEELEITLHGAVFLPMQSINELRRTGLERLQYALLEPYRRAEKAKIEPMEHFRDCQNQPALFVYVEQLEQLEIVLGCDAVRRVYLDCNAVEHIWKNETVDAWISKVHAKGKEIYLAMPHIFRKQTIARYEEGYDTCVNAAWDGMLIRNYEGYAFLQEHGYEKPIVTDHNLYVMNQYAKTFWEKRGVEHTTASVELNDRELRAVGINHSEMIVYGHLPMMISAQCIRHTTKGCDGKKGQLVFTDRYQKKFVVKNHCDYCYNVIYNTAPLVLTDRKGDVLALAPKALRMHFTIESQDAVRELLELYDRVFIKDGSEEEPDLEFTRGHFKRGIK